LLSGENYIMFAGMEHRKNHRN